MPGAYVATVDEDMDAGNTFALRRHCVQIRCSHALGKSSSSREPGLRRLWKDTVRQSALPTAVLQVFIWLHGPKVLWEPDHPSIRHLRQIVNDVLRMLLHHVLAQTLDAREKVTFVGRVASISAPGHQISMYRSSWSCTIQLGGRSHLFLTLGFSGASCAAS